MATFTDLYRVGQVLEAVIADAVGAIVSPGNVRLGVPIESPDSSSAQVRVTLLWVNEQPAHRNDPRERSPSGVVTLPPLTLSAWYLVTTYGNSAQGVPIGAHQALAAILQRFHDDPIVELPLPSLPEVGEGALQVVLAQLTLEQIEKIFTPLQVKQRPFALYEVRPVRLLNTGEAPAAASVVLPGGLVLEGPSVAARPTLDRVTPGIQGIGGRIRVDGTFNTTTAPRFYVGGAGIEPASVTEIAAGESYSFALPAEVEEGTHAISATTVAKVEIETVDLLVVEADAPSLDAPASTRSQSMGLDLVLAGRGLLPDPGFTDGRMLAWPDAGVRSPSDLHEMPLDAHSGTLVRVLAADLAVLIPGDWRFAVRVDENRYTPYLVLTVTA